MPAWASDTEAEMNATAMHDRLTADLESHMDAAELDRRTFCLVRRPQEVRRIADGLGIRGPVSAGIVRHRLAKLFRTDPVAVEALLRPPRPMHTPAIVATM